MHKQLLTVHQLNLFYLRLARDLFWLWFVISVTILCIGREWTIVAYIITFGLGYGGIIYTQRTGIKSFFIGRGLNRYPVFLALAILVSVLEELYVFALGNRTAVPGIINDIIVVPGEWAVWFTVWYFVIARRYSLGENEALICAGLSGIMFEYIGTGLFLQNIAGFIVSIPTTIVVYASIFVLPMQLITFDGKVGQKRKYIISTVLPYLSSIPATVLLYMLISI